jgi:tellurite resistance protein TerC
MRMASRRDYVRWIGRTGLRVLVTVVGFTLIAVGLVLLVLPGPGILVIIAGFAVLATQYAWARTALEATKRRASRTAKRLRRRASGTA